MRPGAFRSLCRAANSTIFLSRIARRLHLAELRSVACAARQGPNNTIKADQVLFQAQKKVTGNTHTARGMPLNVIVFIGVVSVGTIQVLSALRKLYWGVGKIELNKD